jgi:hypothetical protein
VDIQQKERIGFQLIIVQQELKLDAGIKPQKKHFWGKEFLDRKFAVMIEALTNHVHLNTTEEKKQFEQKIGFIPGCLKIEEQRNGMVSVT